MTDQPKYGVTFETWMKLSAIASELLFIGIKDGGVKHEPDQFRKQGYAVQIEHAVLHLSADALARPADGEDHLAHALTRILFAELLRREANDPV